MKTGEFNPWGPLARLSARMRGQTVEVTVEANLWRVLDVVRERGDAVPLCGVLDVDIP